MANILVFTTDRLGHHLEYLHHYYDFALKDVGNHYFFCVSKDFHDVKSTYTWQEADNILVEFIEDEDLDKCIKGGNGFINIIKLSFAKSKYLNKNSIPKFIKIQIARINLTACLLCFLLNRSSSQPVAHVRTVDSAINSTYLGFQLM